jgi:hypothetical protein
MKKDERDYFAPPAGFNREAYDHIRDNPFLAVASNPLSTFSIDVDTASYANVRRFLTSGQLPPKDAVRIEELVNYFRFDYPEPEGDAPFSISTEVGRCPWKPEHRLALVGLRGRSLDEENLPPRNLTFLLDVSGSMNSADKLPLLKRAMGVLVDTLREEDHVAIVVYAGASGLVLPPTSGAGKGEIQAALNSLRAGGSTAGGAGIELAYRVATDSFIEGGINRVILATDGDFNVGVSSEGDLVRLIEQKRETGVFLSVLGFGRGNLQDSKMEKLADHGNGNYSYIDSFREARKVLGTEAGGTLVTIAKDVKIQQDPGRVQPGSRERLPPHWIREPGPAGRGLRRRPQGRGRDRGRPHRDRPVRDRPRRSRDRAALGRPAEVPAAGRRHPRVRHAGDAHREAAAQGAHRHAQPAPERRRRGRGARARDVRQPALLVGGGGVRHAAP